MVNPSTESILNQMTNLAMDIALDYVLPASPMSDVCKSDLLDMEREVAAAVNSVNSLLGSGLSCCGRPPANLCKKNSYIGAAGCDSCTACMARQLDNKSTGSASAGSAASTTTGTAETTMDISWCQFDGCEFDTADNSYLDICDWIFYADRYALTDENREKVQKAFQMVPPGEVTGYVAPPMTPASSTRGSPSSTITASSIKSEPDDDYLWSSDNHLQPIILKAEPDADILQITELDHSYLQTGATLMPQSSAASSPVKHHHHHHHNLDMLGLVTPPPSRSQSSEEEEIDVVNDSWDTPDTPRKGATMADIMKRGIVKKRDPPVTKWKNTVKRKHKTTTTATTVAAAAASYPMPPPPPKKVCGAGAGGGLSLLDRYKKDNNWKDNTPASSPGRLDDLLKNEPLTDEDEDYDIDAEFENLMKNEPEDIFDDEFDDDDENDADWEKMMMRNTGSGGSTGGKSKPSSSNGGNGSSSGNSSSSSASSSNGNNAGRKKKKKKKGGTKGGGTKHHHQSSSTAGKKVKYESGASSGSSGGYSYKTKLMDPVKRALHNDLEKSRRVETSMLFMNLSMQVSFLDDNRKIPSKLSILRGAKRECDLMMLDERRLLSEKHVMQQKQRMLRERLFELRREQYHRRYGKSQQ